jgi:hypothetical protein
MAVTCANCGTQNPDGNKFCQSCGKPLAAAPVGAAGAPPPAPIPTPTPAAAQAPGATPGGAPMPGPGYQSPYYAPQPGQAAVAVHRTSPGLIIGIIGGLVLLMVGAMVLIGLLFIRPSPNPHPNPVATVANVPATPAPSTPTPVAGSSPPPATPTPRSTPVPTPTPSRPSGSNVIKTSSFQVNAPGWKNLKQDSLSVTLLSPQGDGTLFILAGQLKQPSDTQSWVTSFLTDVGKKYPDAKICLKPAAETHGGKDGIIVGACYTYTPSSGSAFAAADVLWASVDTNNNVFMYEVFCEAKNFDNVYNKETLPVIADNSLQWAA